MSVDYSILLKDLFLLDHFLVRCDILHMLKTTSRYIPVFYFLHKYKQLVHYYMYVHISSIKRRP